MRVIVHVHNLQKTSRAENKHVACYQVPNLLVPHSEQNLDVSLK